MCCTDEVSNLVCTRRSSSSDNLSFPVSLAACPSDSHRSLSLSRFARFDDFPECLFGHAALSFLCTVEPQLRSCHCRNTILSAQAWYVIRSQLPSPARRILHGMLPQPGGLVTTANLHLITGASNRSLVTPVALRPPKLDSWTAFPSRSSVLFVPAPELKSLCPFMIEHSLCAHRPG